MRCAGRREHSAVAEGEDEVDLAGVFVEFAGDLDGRDAFVGELIDAIGDGIGLVAKEG